MFLAKFVIFFFSNIILGVTSFGVTSFGDTSLEIYIHCNDKVSRNKFFLRDVVKGKPYLRNDLECESINSEIKILIPSLKLSAKTSLKSNIILEIIKEGNKVLGVNLFKNFESKNTEYIFQEIKLIEQDYITDIIAQERKIEPVLEVKKEQSFLKKYWWLIAIGLLAYSVLTVDTSSIDSVQNVNSEQVQQNSIRRRT